MLTTSLNEEESKKMELQEENDPNNFISDHESDSEKWNFPSQIEDSYLNYKTDAPTNSSVVGSIEGSATGMLIVDAGRSPSRRSIQVDALSYPDSIPTEIMSLGDGERYNKNVVDNLSNKSKNTITTTSAMDNDDHQSLSGKKRLLLLQVASVIILSLMTINGYLLWHHGELQQHHEKLETQIDDLLKEVNEMKHSPTQLVAATTTNKDKIIGGNNDSPKFALFDNCWFKAEIEIGNCLNDIKECWYDIASNAYSTWNTIFEENKDNDADYNHTTNDANNNTITILQADWNTMFVETTDTIANVTASLFDSILYSKNTMEESFWNATQSIEESLWYATEQVRDIIQDASIYSQL